MLRANAPNCLPPTCPQSSKASENQYYIHVAAAEATGYFPDPKLRFAGGCPNYPLPCLPTVPKSR